MKILIALLITLVVSAATISAQTTGFTYQGKLTETAGTAASYDFEFRLFSIETDGVVLATNQRLGVAVSNGVFTVRLDFGSNFDGGPRWLEIAVRSAGSSGGFQPLLPRQPITSTPYAVRSLNSANADNAANAASAVIATNSTQLGGVNANEYVTIANNTFIRNNTTQQTGNFNISGDGVVGGKAFIGIPSSSLAKLTVSALTTNLGDNTARFEASSIGPHFSHIHFGQTGDWYIRSAAATGKVLLQDSGGNVGIGTSSPAYKLHIVANEPNSQFRYEGNGVNANPSFYLKSNFGNARMHIDRADVGGNALIILASGGVAKWTYGIPNDLSGDPDRLDFASTSGYVMTMKQSGNVGIGTTAPSERLHVEGNSLFSGHLVTGGTLQLGNYSSNPTPCTTPNAGKIYYRGDAPAIVLCNGTEWVRITSTEIQTLNYERLEKSVNAFKEQQQTIQRQQQQIDALKKIVCGLKPEAAICMESQNRE